MDVKELKQQSEKHLHDLLAEKRTELQALRFQAASRSLKQMHLIANARKSIAQIHTILRLRRETHESK